MIHFQPITLEDISTFNNYLHDGQQRGCEYSFANLYLWGRQKAAILHDHLLLFSQFNRKTVYPFPVGKGDKRQVLESIIADSKERGIPCRLTCLTQADIELMEQLFPGRFRYHCDRDFYDYVYAIDDLADLKGRKYQRKRNHFNRFRDSFPYYHLEPLGEKNLPAVREMVEDWYESRIREDPEGDYYMERAALNKALRCYEQLAFEGLVLLDGEKVLAMTMGSRMSPDTFDIHFEKARPEADTAYTVINCEFARYLRERYPEVKYLNREDDMGLEGLRKAKLSYCPHHMVEKCWACLLEDGYDY